MGRPVVSTSSEEVRAHGMCLVVDVESLLSDGTSNEEDNRNSAWQESKGKVEFIYLLF